MQPVDFKKDSWGKLIKAPGGYWAFVPNPLPPKVAIGWDLTNNISAADRSMGELVGIARTLPNPYLLVRPFMRREAVLSSRIEGTQASLSQLLLFEAAETTAAPDSDVREVLNYVTALEEGLALLKELPVSMRLIRGVHGRLMDKVRGQHRTPGEFRTSQNWIGPPGCTLNEATFIPPPVSEMKNALGELEKFLHEKPAFPPLVQLALIHYQFEAIHPFLDGNGRVGRLLIILLLCAERLLPQPLLYLSAYFERNRKQYYDLLLEVSQEGNWAEWIRFFLRGVEEESRDAVKRSDKLLRLWQGYRERFQSARSSALLLRLVDELFSRPAITVSWAATRLRITPRAAQLNIDKLVASGILKEATGRQRNRIYVANGIVRIVDAPKAN